MSSYNQNKKLFFWDLFETSIVQVYSYTSAAMAGGAFAGLFTPHAVLVFSFAGGLVTGLVKTLDTKISQYLGEPAPEQSPLPIVTPTPTIPPAVQPPPDAAQPKT